MSLSLYLDDCAYDKQLVRNLVAAGHTVTVPAEIATTGMKDEVHLREAATRQLVVVTKNPGDFEELHHQGVAHAGILAICQDNDSTRDMNYGDIVKEIANLETAGIEITGQYHILNSWRY